MKVVGLSTLILLLCLTDLNWRTFAEDSEGRALDLSQFTNPVARQCADTGNCDRTLCDDKLEAQPLECLEHIDEMACFRVCKDPKVLLDCIKENEGNMRGVAWCAIIFRRKLPAPIQADGSKLTGHTALPCSLKCRTDPKFWSCVHKCDERGCFSTFHDCETKPRNGSVDPRPWCDREGDPNYLTRIECRDCYAYNLTTELKDSKECTIRYAYLGPGADSGTDETTTTTTANPNPQQGPTTTTTTTPQIVNGTKKKEKAPVKFGDVQNRCIYPDDISNGTKPEFNQTLPFELIRDCLKRMGIIFPDDPDPYGNKSTKGQPTTTTAAPGAAPQQVTTPRPHVPPSAIPRDFLERCVKVELAVRQIQWCLQAEGTKARFYKYCQYGTDGRTQTLACQQHCMKHLTKPYCYIPCPRNREIETCEEDCNRKFPLLKCECTANPTDRKGFFMDAAARLARFKERTRACPDQLCYYEALHDEKPAIPNPNPPNVPPPKDEWEQGTTMLRNCRSFRHLKLFSKKFAPGVFADDIQELSSYYTPYECSLDTMDCASKSANGAAHCGKKCITKKRTHEEMDEDGICVPNPPNDFTDKNNHLRPELTLWCLNDTFPGRKWTLQEYFHLADSVEDYFKMLECEKKARSLQGNHLSADQFENFARITYEIEEEWCKKCVTTNDDNPHEYEIDHVECEISQCYKGKATNSCKPLKKTSSQVQLVASTECSWQVDYSLSRDPNRLWSTYFDEISPHDETSTLTEPDTLSYLSKSVVTFGKGYYVFPYFVVVRPICDDGYYDEDIYKFIASGATPVVKITYIPYSSRAKHVDLMYSLFQGALINLERVSDEEKRYIPQNPRNRKMGNDTEYDGMSGCHLGVCYPAFAVPQVLIHVPIVDVSVYNQQVFSSVKHKGYVSTFHVRDIPGAGKLKIANTTDHPTPDLFFPKEKAQTFEDVQFIDLFSRLPDSGYGLSGRFAGEPAENDPGPEIEYQTDANCVERPHLEPFQVGGNIHAPLDTEDFFRMQYTYGNVPQVVIAGFYDPNLVIIGDPDMKKFELARWGYEAKGGLADRPSARLFTGAFKCFSHHYPLGGYIKPMYSSYDRLDALYWLQFYRMRYLPKNYTDTVATKAIFEAYALEDRILLLTSSGLVSIYNNYNKTALLGKPWEVEGKDRLEKCFKIVRIARRSHPITDTIVGITYDYQVAKIGGNDSNSSAVDDISQQIYIGRYTGAGKKIEWENITGGVSTQNLKEERVYNVGGDKLGQTEALPLKKPVEIPVERRETAPRSQIEAICYKVYRDRMGKAEYIELIEDQGWCDAIDATPVVAIESKIQVLVRMKAYYSGGTGSGGNEKIKRIVFFYVVASINTDKAGALYSVWQIDAIIPRVPCLDEHTQSIPNVVQFNMKYFKKGDPGLIGRNYGCHELAENKRAENIIMLHGMTYTRSFSLHMFLYGNKLLQSADGGQTFVHLKSFPDTSDPKYHEHCLRGGNVLSTNEEAQLFYHRIKLMAFDDKGHYAFLTSKRELWYGNIGTLELIRLRPSPSYSMVQTTLFEVPEIIEAVPFAIFFDSSNELVEMVAVVNAKGVVTRIARRVVDERVIIRARHFIEHIDKKGEAILQNLKREISTNEPNIAINSEHETMTPFRYDPIAWSVFCPFASPNFHHNFSELYARAQSFFFPPPRQHPNLGIIHTKSSLMTYQAVAFNLVWNSFFIEFIRQYSYLNEDPFKTWKKLKVDAAVIGRLKYLNLDPQEHGVLVLPDKYKRFFHTGSDAKRIFSIYYMDYNMVVHISIEYSISNDFTLTPIDYVRHRLSAIQLNVDNSNGTLIQINTEKEIVASRAAVRYIIHMSIKKGTGLVQQYSGRNAVVIPIYFHLIGAFGKCVPTESSGILGDSIATAIGVGCPPSFDLVFNWNASVHSIKFRNISAHFGDEGSECYDGESFCFFVRNPLILHFHVFDKSKQSHVDFSGKYIMRIVGGGYTREEIRDYTVEEQQAFNVPGVSDVSLIWNQWDSETHEKKEQTSDKQSSGRNDSREIVLQAGVSAIKWACHTLSPCARISPRINLESIYYFKVFVTNRGVDNDTLCLYEKEFVILLYGFPPSPELQLITTLAFYIGILLLLYTVYLFFRNKKKLWNSSILKLQGWLQIVKDTFPNLWGSEVTEELETEEERKKRHDEILMSLQGHLNVPLLVPHQTGHGHDEKAEGFGRKESETSLQRSASASLSSFKSGSSGSSQNPLLNPVAGRAGAATWTDMIYEQIISKRLAAIIEKNRKDTEELKKKVARGEAVKEKKT